MMSMARALEADLPLRPFATHLVRVYVKEIDYH